MDYPSGFAEFPARPLVALCGCSDLHGLIVRQMGASLIGGESLQGTGDSHQAGDISKGADTQLVPASRPPGLALATDALLFGNDKNDDGVARRLLGAVPYASSIPALESKNGPDSPMSPGNALNSSVASNTSSASSSSSSSSLSLASLPSAHTTSSASSPVPLCVLSWRDGSHCPPMRGSLDVASFFGADIHGDAAGKDIPEDEKSSSTAAQQQQQHKGRRHNHDGATPAGILKADWARKHLTGVPAAVAVLCDWDTDPPNGSFRQRESAIASEIEKIRKCAGGRKTKIVIALVHRREKSDDAHHHNHHNHNQQNQQNQHDAGGVDSSANGKQNDGSNNNNNSSSNDTNTSGDRGDTHSDDGSDDDDEHHFASSAHHSTHIVSHGGQSDERASSLRKRCDVDAKQVVSLYATDIPGSVHKLHKALWEAARTVYRDEGRRLKKLKEKLNKGSQRQLLVRLLFKIGHLAEQRHDMGPCLKYYQQAYNHIPELTSPPQRCTEAKTVAEIIHLKICKVHMLNGHIADAVSQMSRHVSMYKHLLGVPQKAFEHWAWMTRQYAAFAGLLVDMEKSGVAPAFSSAERWYIRPGYYFQMAATFAAQRAKVARQLKASKSLLAAEGRNPTANSLSAPGFEGTFGEYVGQLPVVTSLKDALDPLAAPTSVPLEEDVKRAVRAESMCDHTSIIVSLLTCAKEHFADHPRMVAYIDARCAKVESDKCSVLESEVKAKQQESGTGEESADGEDGAPEESKKKRMTMAMKTKLAAATAHIEQGNKASLALVDTIVDRYRRDGWFAILSSLLETSLSSSRRLSDPARCISDALELIGDHMRSPESKSASPAAESVVCLLSSLEEPIDVDVTPRASSFLWSIGANFPVRTAFLHSPFDIEITLGYRGSPIDAQWQTVVDASSIEVRFSDPSFNVTIAHGDEPSARLPEAKAEKQKDNTCLFVGFDSNGPELSEEAAEGDGEGCANLAFSSAKRGAERRFVLSLTATAPCNIQAESVILTLGSAPHCVRLAWNLPSLSIPSPPIPLAHPAPSSKKQPDGNGNLSVAKKMEKTEKNKEKTASKNADDNDDHDDDDDKEMKKKKKKTRKLRKAESVVYTCNPRAPVDFTSVKLVSVNVEQPPPTLEVSIVDHGPALCCEIFPTVITVTNIAGKGEAVAGGTITIAAADKDANSSSNGNGSNNNSDNNNNDGDGGGDDSDTIEIFADCSGETRLTEPVAFDDVPAGGQVSVIVFVRLPKPGIRKLTVCANYVSRLAEDVVQRTSRNIHFVDPFEMAITWLPGDSGRSSRIPVAAGPTGINPRGADPSDALTVGESAILSVIARATTDIPVRLLGVSLEAPEESGQLCFRASDDSNSNSNDRTRYKIDADADIIDNITSKRPLGRGDHFRVPFALTPTTASAAASPGTILIQWERAGFNPSLARSLQAAASKADESARSRADSAASALSVLSLADTEETLRLHPHAHDIEHTEVPLRGPAALTRYSVPPRSSPTRPAASLISVSIDSPGTARLGEPIFIEITVRNESTTHPVRCAVSLSESADFLFAGSRRTDAVVVLPRSRVSLAVRAVPVHAGKTALPRVSVAPAGALQVVKDGPCVFVMP